MFARTRVTVSALATIASMIASATSVEAQSAVPTPLDTLTEMAVTNAARGTFDVKLNPLPTHDTTEGSMLGRLSIDKRFHGDLEATSRGEMLSAMTKVKGSAGYVAIERVTGALHGRTGTFVLQHSGTMTRGTPRLTLTVVPDSGTGELEGLSGSMTIIIDGEKHSYEFQYTIGGPP